MNAEIKKEIYNIKKLINEEKYKEAYSLCNKLLLNFPDNSVLNGLQKKIEKTVFKKNLKSVKKDLKKLKPLWKKQKYKELVEKLESLRSYVPGYAKVEKQLSKARRLYNKKAKKQVKHYFYDKINEIKKLFENDDYEKAYSTAKKLHKQFPKQQKSKEMLESAKDKYIDFRLKQNKSLLNSDKFDQIQSFLKDLLKIKPDSNQIKSLLKRAEKRESISLEFEEKEFVYKSYERILTLYQKKKYEEALKALNELLKVEPDNLKALELRKKARKKFNRKLTKEVIEKIKRLQKKFKKEYLENKKEFIKI
jgi:tetratricopeptide (TPR) repeat protein